MYVLKIKLFNGKQIMGGFFISDDISDNKAFIDFVDKFNLKPYIILFKNKYIGLIIKK